jgi:hypothetical protein
MGLIRNVNQVKQAVDFSGVQNGVIHPSDVDAVLEFNNKFLILMEIKRKNNIIPTGQRLMLERMSDNWVKACEGNGSVVLKVEHEHYDDKTAIPLSKCVVTRFYVDNKWNDCNMPVVSFLQGLGKKWDLNKLKGIS